MHRATTLSTARRLAGLRAVLALALTLVPLGALAAQASSDPYSEDPLRLVPYRDSVQQAYTAGTDRWEVWICDIPEWSEPVEVVSITAQLNQEISPYFQWLSGGRYEAIFEAGGTVTSFDPVSEDLADPGFPESRLIGCEDAVFKTSSSDPNGVLIIADGGYAEGYGSSGFVCPPPLSGCDDVFPNNRRLVVVGAGSVTAVGEFPARLMVIAHEIGHALDWAHSFGGVVTRTDGSVNQYDNILDVMSGSAIEGGPIGTHAYNRYAAGWIESEDVVVYEGGTQTYPLVPIGDDGHEMLAIPVSEGFTYTFGLRSERGFDQSIAKSGVESYLIDSRQEACTALLSGPPNSPCYGAATRISPIPAPGDIRDTSHVHSVGDAFSVGSWWLSVLQDSKGGIHLRVTDGAFNGRFVDDDGNLHEAAIESIEAAGITKGCDPPANDYFCPSDEVSRATMSVFLSRALGESTSGSTHNGYFADVPAVAWYAADVERLHELGIVLGYPDGNFKPDEPVTRGEMAAFITRAFGLQLGTGSGQVFQDVAAEAWYSPHVEAVQLEGITTGCSVSPTLYCPQEPVLRDQMASFLARALGLSP